MIRVTIDTGRYGPGREVFLADAWAIRHATPYPWLDLHRAGRAIESLPLDPREPDFFLHIETLLPSGKSAPMPHKERFNLP